LESIEENALSGRAWAFQERLLSPRILHFTQKQLFWECRTSFCAEDLVPRDHGSAKPGLVLQVRAMPNMELKLYVWCTWVLCQYTDARLTVPTDRLTAVSALARLFYQELKSPYLAGLWQEGLWYTLSWVCCKRDGEARRSEQYIAPSWSWASVNAPVRWLIQSPGIWKIVQLLKIEDAAVEHDQDPFGQVSYGYIRVTGHVLLNQSVAGRRSAELGIIDLDYPRDSPVRVDCILMGERKTWGDSGKAEVYFLLVAVSSKDPNVYERHGIAHGFSRANFSEWPTQTFTII
jgi:hypothetical protein